MTDNIKSMYIMMVSVAFIDGALRITNIPTFYLWKDYLQCSPGVNCLLRYITKLPWCIKPVFAYFSDRHYIFGYRTKIYFILTGVVETICFILLGLKVKSILYTVVLVFIEQATIAFRDCLAEGLMVVISQKEDEENNKESGGIKKKSSSQKYVSVIFILRFVGALSSSYFAGILLERFDAHQVLVLSAIFPIIATIQAAFFFKEERVYRTEAVRDEFKNFSLKEILDFIEEKNLKHFLFYILIMLLWPNTINGVRYFLIDNLGFTTQDIGLIFTLSSLFYVVYMFFMNTFFSNYTLKNYYISICLMMIIDVVVRYMQLTPSMYSLAFLFAVIDQSINNLFYDIPSIPLLAIVCRNCPKSKEATYYGFFVSFSNFLCSLSNFTGYLFLDMMDVTETDFSNVQSVNIMCLVWAIMCWDFAYHVNFPETIKLKNVKETERVPLKPLKIIKRVSHHKDQESKKRKKASDYDYSSEPLSDNSYEEEDEE